jgi:hypothetical protein
MARFIEINNNKINSLKELHQYIDTLPINSKEYWEAISMLPLIKPPIAFTSLDMVAGSY